MTDTKIVTHLLIQSMWDLDFAIHIYTLTQKTLLNLYDSSIESNADIWMDLKFKILGCQLSCIGLLPYIIGNKQ